MNTRIPILAALLGTLASATAGAACPAPELVARKFFDEHRHFEREDPAALRGVVTDAMHKRLQREWDCSAGHSKTCRLRYDLWSGLRDGSMPAPVTFATDSQTEEVAVVAYSFWIHDGVDQHNRIGRVLLARKRGCWRVDDFITPNNEALSQIMTRPVLAPQQP